MGSVCCEAIVLGTIDYRESDRILTLFTLEHGKIRGIARGAKKSVRRFGGALEPFALLRTEIVLKEGLSLVQQADILNVFPKIRNDLEKIGLAGYACELTDLMLPEGMANPRLFRLLASYLEHLDSFPPSSSDRRFFEMNFLNVLGYCPSIDRCAMCNLELEKAAWVLYPMAASGLLCIRCGKGGVPLSMETVYLLRRSLKTGRFGAISFSPKLLEEAGKFLDHAIASHLQHPPKSLSFIRETAEQPHHGAFPKSVDR
jgi:DNA repair protein RecO (recombination protein O)